MALWWNWNGDFGRTQGLRLRENKRKIEAGMLMHVHVHERSWLVVHLAHDIQSMQHARSS